MNPTTANANVVNPNKALWEKGDFTQIAAFMRQSGEALVDSLAITPEMRVLDLGCGDGTTAIPLARFGADVVGIDIARNLVEAGNRRAADAGLPLRHGPRFGLTPIPARTRGLFDLRPGDSFFPGSVQNI